MHIAFVTGPGRGDTDLLLASVASRLEDAGLRACGTVQVNTECEGDGPCDMDVQVLPDGPVIRISQTLGPEARGCRLDPGALETAIAACEARLDGAEVLLVNKFGKQEALGRGFRGLIAEALSRDMPVLVGLNALNKDAFCQFTDNVAVEVQPDRDAILSWLLRAVQNRQTVT
jgi:nucleoside-triphosphatase THEP1